MEEILEYLQVQVLELVLCNIFLNDLEKQVRSYPDLITPCSECHTNEEET